MNRPLRQRHHPRENRWRQDLVSFDSARWSAMNDEGYIGREQAPDQPPACTPPVPPPPPPPATGAASGRRPSRVLVVAAIAAVLIAGAGIGVLLGLLTRGGNANPGN